MSTSFLSPTGGASGSARLADASWPDQPAARRAGGAASVSESRGWRDAAGGAGLRRGRRARDGGAITRAHAGVCAVIFNRYNCCCSFVIISTIN